MFAGFIKVWTDVFSRVPGGRESSLRIEARFMEGLKIVAAGHRWELPHGLRFCVVNRSA